MSRLCNILAALAIMACPAFAEFTHPYVSQGQVYTNTMMLDLYWGRYERTDAHYWIGAATNTGPYGPNLSATFQAYTGYTSTVTVVTNGAYVITNSLDYPVYVNATRTNEYCFMPFVISGYTNVPHVQRQMITSLDDYAYELGGAFYWQTWLYARHWESDTNGLFDAWLQSTNGPTIPIIANPGVILSYTNAGFVTNEQYDAWGGVTNSWWAFTRSPPITQDWNIAEIYVGVTNVAGTNSAAWRFRENTLMDYNHLTTNDFPSFVFTSGGVTSAIGTISITITGDVFSAVDGQWTPDATRPDQGIIATSETVTLSTNAQALTKRWRRITDITASGPLSNTGHTWSVVYDGPLTLYGGMAYTLRAVDLNERRSVIDGMRWTYSNPDVGISPNFDDLGSTQLTWTASSTNSWADAKTLAEASTPAGVINHERAQQWTSGGYDTALGYPRWTASAVASRAKRLAYGEAGDNLTTDLQYTLDFYSKTTIPAYSNVEHYTYSATWMTTTGLYYGVAAITTAVGNVWAGYGGDDGWFGSTNFPSEWCAEPTAGTLTTFKGYEMDKATYTILRWDATTNGFRYRR